MTRQKMTHKGLEAQSARTAWCNTWLFFFREMSFENLLQRKSLEFLANEFDKLLSSVLDSHRA